MSANTYDIGDVVDMSGTFTDPLTDAPVDPTLVACTLRDPAGVVTTPIVTRGSLGLFTASAEVTMAGVWRFAFDGTGDVKASGERIFLVRAQRVPR